MRVDFNVPMDKGDRRNHRRNPHHGRAAVHQVFVRAWRKGYPLLPLGRPKGEFNMKFSLAPVARRPGQVVDTKVIMAKDVVGGDAKKMRC